VLGIQLIDDGSEVSEAVGDEFTGNGGFESVDFIVEGLDGNRNLLLMKEIGTIETWDAFERNINHEHHHGGKEEFLFVLEFGGVVKELVHSFGMEVSLEDGSYENGGGCFLGEGFDFLTELKHGRLLAWRRGSVRNPVLRTGASSLT